MKAPGKELWRSLGPNDRRFLLQMLLPLVVLILATLPVAWFWGTGWAALVGYGGTLAVFGGNLLWIVFSDSKKRWPEVKAFDRFARVVTFYRD